MEPEDPRERMYQDTTTAVSSVFSERGDILRNGSTSPVEDEKGMYSCDKCQYKAKQRSNLMRHYYTMHADLSDQLECCGQLYSTKGDFRQHVKTVHKQGYLCKLCNRTFSRKALLKRHSYVHNGIREFKCEHCNYATSHKSNLERHFKVHTPLLRKRRCRLSYRITNSYPKHLTVDGQHGPLLDHSSMNDRGHPLGPVLSAIPGCPSYRPLPRAAHSLSKYQSPLLEEPLTRTHYPVRSPLEEYENLIKLQLMKETERRRSFPSEELNMLHHLSNPPHKPTPILGHQVTPPINAQSRLKNTVGACDTNCFCQSNPMWMLPVYQSYLSSHDFYSHLNNRALNSLHPGLVRTGLRDSRTSGSRSPTNSSATSQEQNDERSVYLQLLKMQSSVASSDKSRLYGEDVEVVRSEKRVAEVGERQSDTSADEREVSPRSPQPKLPHKIPQSDQPLKKRYKRFFIENIK